LSLPNPSPDELNGSPISEEKLEALFNELDKGGDKLFRQLSTEQRAWIIQLLEKWQVGDSAMLEALYAKDYERIPVPPEVFFTEKDYLGHIGKDIYKAWWPHVLNICNPSKRIYEVIFTGAIGYGKSHVMNAVILPYRIYRLSCLKNPARYFGLASDSSIVFGVYAITLTHVDEIGFYILREQAIDKSPYFREVFPRVQKGGEAIIFPKGIRVIAGSSALHAIGKNLIGISCDEVNFYNQGKATAGKAHELASAVARRLESRFQGSDGELLGVVGFVSSKRTETDFLDQRIVKIKNQPGVYIVDAPLWEFNERVNYCGKTFRVQLGDEVRDAQLLDAVDYVEGDWKVTVAAIPDAEANIIEVPVEHYKPFVEDPNGAIRDIAGRSTKGFLPFIPRRIIINNMLDVTLPKSFDKEITPLHVGSPGELSERFAVDRVCRVHMNRWQPVRHPGAPRYIHIDLAVRQDRAGIAMLHPAGHYMTTEKDFAGNPVKKDGVEVETIVKDIEVDFCLAVVAGPKGEEIDFQKIRNFLIFLRNVGYWIRLITFDSYQSVDSIQLLRGIGFEAEVQSVDRTIAPYKVFRQTMAEGRIKCPPHELLRAELGGLEYDAVREKVDHQQDGSKDVSDAICGAIYRCSLDKIRPSDVPPDRRGMVSETAAGKYDRFLSQIKNIGL